MYDPQEEFKQENPTAKNKCPNCSTPISMWDYVKPNAKKANKLECKYCGSILRYKLNAFETLCFLILGLLVGVGPAFFFWPPHDFIGFCKGYLPIAIPLFIAIRPLEGWYVRRYKLVELVERANK